MNIIRREGVFAEQLSALPSTLMILLMLYEFCGSNKALFGGTECQVHHTYLFFIFYSRLFLLITIPAIRKVLFDFQLTYNVPPLLG